VTTHEEWQRIDAALDEIMALPRDAWAPACARIAAGDERLHRELESLLLHMSDDDAALSSITAGPPNEPAPPKAALPPGTVLGSYSVGELIGRGGMGEVYRAERIDGHFKQKVAIKVMRRELVEQPRRFQAERQILARLQHPNIASLYDGGVSEDGHPFMVMEFVAGRSITQWCQEHTSTLTERLQLFIAVCEAVAYAHRNLIVHRDLKPANVLVTDEGQVKLLDFGVARLLDEAPSEETRHVAVTPGYAAPEQLTGAPVTTATDVYALGMLLFELLAGASPWASGNLPVAILVARIMNQDSPPLSQFSRSRPAAPVAAKLLAGDLDAIVAKAVRKEPERRYESVALLRSDILNMLRSQPVAAREGARWYVVGRFLRRHRVGIAATGLLVLAIVVGAIGVAWQAHRANAEALRARTVQSFLLSLFKGNLPEEARGHELTARELLARGTQQLDLGLDSQPLALAELHSDLGDMYQELSDYQNGLAQLDRALTLYSTLGESKSAVGIEALFRRGTVLLALHRYDAANADLQRVIEWGPERFGPRNRWAVAAREKLIDILANRGDRTGAMRLANEALALPVGIDQANDAVRRLRIRAKIGSLQADQGDTAAARATLAAVVADSVGPAGYDVTDRYTYRTLFARAVLYDGDYAEAARQGQVLVADMDRVLGASYSTTINARELLGQALGGLGHYDEATEVEKTNLLNLQARHQPDAEAVATERGILSNDLKAAYRFSEAAPLMADVTKFFDDKYPSHTLDTEYWRRVAGEILVGQGALAQGTALIETALNNGHTLADFDASPDAPGALAALAAAKRLAGDWLQSEALLEQACIHLRQAQGPDATHTRWCEAQLQWVRAMRNPADPTAAAAFSNTAQRYREKLAPGHVGFAELRLMECDLQQRAGHENAAARKAAEEQWRGAMHRSPPSQLFFLH
jgi:eukaryotic-like serine/threonine-protein kinase